MLRPCYLIMTLSIAVLLLLGSAGCSKTATDSSGSNTENVKPKEDMAKKEAEVEKKKIPVTLEDAKVFVSQFVVEGADVEKLSKQLQPTHEDYLAVFNEEFAKKAEALYTPVWKSGAFVIRGKPGQTEVRVFSGTSSELKQWKGSASKTFPGGYKRVAKEYNDGVTVYCFKFIKPGEEYGMSFNGLVHVNGHWRMIPKPWRVK